MADGAGGKEVGRISIRVVPNLDKFYRDLEEGLQKADRLEVHIRVVADGLAELREKINAETSNLKTAEVKVKPNVDRAAFERALAETKAAAKAADVKLKVDIEDKAAEAKLAGTIAKLKLEAKAANIKVDVDVDRKAGASALGGLFGGGARALGSLHPPDVLPNIGGLGGLPSLALIVGAASLLAPALALFSQVAVSLPGLLAGIALPLGVFALGIGGIKKALDDVGVLSEGKKGKQGIGDVLKKIQQPIADTFEKGFKPIFQSLVDAANQSPVFTRGLQFIASGIVNFATGISSALTSVPNLEMVNRLTNSVGTMLTNLAPGMTSFANGMIRLTTDVGDHLPGLGNWLTGLGDRFSNWISEIDTPKKDWFGKDVPGSSTLDSAISNMKPILNSIVDFVGKLTDAGLKLAANPQMADNIKKVVDGITNLVLNVLPQLNTVFDKIAAIMGAINPPFDPKNPPPNTVPAPGENHAGLPPGVAPAWDPPGQGDKHKPGHPGWKWDQGKGAWVDEQSRYHFDDPFPRWSNPKGWGHWMTEQFERAPSDHPTIVPMGPGGQQQPLPPQPFTPSPGLPGLLLPGQTPAPAQPRVGDILGQLQSAQQAVKAPLANIADGSDKVWDKLVEATKKAGADIVAEVQSWADKIKTALQAAADAASSIGHSIGDGLASGIRASTAGAVSAAVDMANQVRDATKHALDSHSPSRVFQAIGQDTAQGFQNGLEQGFQGVINSATSLIGQLQAAIKNGTSVGPGVRDQIKNELADLGVEHDQLRVQLDQTTDKGQKKSIEGQLKQVQTARDQLNLQSDQLGFSHKYGESVDDNTKLMQGMVTKTAEIGKNFADTNVKQFIGDIGGSGNGAVEQIADIGIGFLSSTLSKLFTGGAGGKAGGDTHFHVGSVDDALAADRTLKNRQAMQFVDRS